MKFSNISSTTRIGLAAWFTTFSLVGCSHGLRSSGSPQDPATYQGLGAESVDPADLKKFAPPPLPAELANRVRNMLEVQTPGMGLLAPNGKTMYFGWSVTGVPQVWRLDRPLGFPEQMTGGSDATFAIEISPDGEWLVVGRDRKGEENPGLYLQRASGGPLIEIQHKKGVQTRFVWITNDSRTIYFMANDIKPDSFALYSYDLETRRKELLFDQPGLWFVGDVRGDRHFLFGRNTGSRTREYFTWDTDDRKLVPVLGQGELSEYQVQFGGEAGEYFVLTPKFGEFKRLYRFRNGKFTPITPEVARDVESFDIDFSRKKLFLQWNDGGRSRLEVLSAVDGRVIPTPEFPGADHVVAGRVSRYGRYVTIGVVTSLEPRANWVLDYKTGALTQWVRSSLPEVDRTTFVASTLEHYPARDGTKIPMWVTRPKTCAKDPCPVIVHFHGGPESQSRPGFNKLIQLATQMGFVFVEPNVRGSEGYGDTWSKSDDGAKRLNVVTDIEDCAKFIRASWKSAKAEPKIGVMGWSYGGYSTLLAMSKFAGSYDAGVALVGMSDLRSFLLNTAPYRRQLRVTEYGDPEKDREALAELSPVTYIDRVKDPLMIIQGVSDPRVPAGEAIQMHRRLEAKGVASSLILFADEGHGASSRENQVLETGHILQFFSRHLQ